MALYYVPCVLVVEVDDASTSKANEVGQRIIDGLGDLSPKGLQGIAMIDNMPNAIPGEYGWFDHGVEIVVEPDETFTLRLPI